MVLFADRVHLEKVYKNCEIEKRSAFKYLGMQEGKEQGRCTCCASLRSAGCAGIRSVLSEGQASR